MKSTGVADRYEIELVSTSLFYHSYHFLAWISCPWRSYHTEL